MNKILLCLQAWEGDISQAEDLAHLLCDLSPKRSPYLCADIALVTRFDCRPFNKKVLARLEQCFENVHEHVGSRRETGWPGGCNALWFSTIFWSAQMLRDKRFTYPVLFTTEADSCPLVQDWDQQLFAEWNKAEKVVVGDWLDSGSDECGHINGNMLVDSDIATMDSKLIGCDANQAWDTVLAPTFKRLGWYDTPLIHSIWNTETLPDAEIKKLSEDKVVWLHGIKDSSVRDYVAKKFAS
jgi:hypothetical protein